jgi:Leucine-rich repeat (LRR) protein
VKIFSKLILLLILCWSSIVIQAEMLEISSEDDLIEALYLNAGALELEIYSPFGQTFLESLAEQGFPAEGKERIAKLSFHNAGVTHIPSGCFVGMKNLKELSFQYERIYTLRPASFEGLGNLENLILKDNETKELKAGCFVGLDNLIQLSLKRNEIDEILPEYWKGLPSLKHLNIGGNKFHRLAAQAFATLCSLETLRMAYSCIKEMEMGCLAGLAELMELKLDGNPLKNLHPKLLAGLNNLEEVYLFDCDLEKFPIEWAATSIRILDLQSNNITALPEGFLEKPSASGPYKMESLHIGLNRLLGLPYRCLSGAENLEVLVLKHNLLSSVDRNRIDSLTPGDCEIVDEESTIVDGSPTLDQKEKLFDMEKEHAGSFNVAAGLQMRQLGSKASRQRKQIEKRFASCRQHDEEPIEPPNKKQRRTYFKFWPNRHTGLQSDSFIEPLFKKI